MSQQLEQFHQLILQNHSLKSQLKSAGDFNSFINMTVSLARDHGYSFTAKEVERYINENMLTILRQFS